MFCTSVFGLFAESLTRLRIRHESEHQRAPRRFPARSTPHPSHRPFARSTPSRHSCEQYTSGISRRVQRISASTLPHSSHASLEQTPYAAKAFACCSTLSLKIAPHKHQRISPIESSPREELSARFSDFLL